jgi:hypothetical protein
VTALIAAALTGYLARLAQNHQGDIRFLAAVADAAIRHHRGGRHTRAWSRPHLVWRAGQHVRYAPELPAITAPAPMKELTA